jgi:hypothetical protein
MVDRSVDKHLDKAEKDELAAEARRQSLLASAVTTEDEEFWHKLADVSTK